MSRSRRARGAIAAGCGLLLIVTLGGWLLLRRSSGTARPPLEVARVERALPGSTQLQLATSGALALTPDARALVSVGAQGTETRLFLHYLDKFDAVPIRGTEDAVMPFLSPDGVSVGFFRRGEVVVLTLATGVLDPALSGEAFSSGATFGPDGTVVVGIRDQGLRVLRAADSTKPGPLTVVNHENGERAHSWPRWVPSLGAIIFTIEYDTPGADAIGIARWDAPAEHAVLTRGLIAGYLDSGHLLVGRPDGLWVAPVDRQGQLAADPVLVIPDVAISENRAPQFAATGRHVAYVTDTSAAHNLIAARPTGASYLLTSRKAYQQPRLSPDGRDVAVTFRRTSGQQVLAVHSLDDGVVRREVVENVIQPRWSADSDWVVFATRGGSSWQLRWISRTGDESGPLLIGRASSPPVWQPPTHELIRSEGNPAVWLLPRDPWGCSVGIHARHDSELVAFSEAKPPGQRRTVIFSGSRLEALLERDSFEPVWSADGRWLFARQAAALVRRRVLSTEPLTLGDPEVVIPIGVVDGPCGVPNYDVSETGDLVVAVYEEEMLPPSRVRLVLNFAPDLRPR